MQSKRRYVRGALLLAAGTYVGIALVSGSSAQVPPPPTFTIPTFTIPDIPTTDPPPTMPPETTTPSPPPTMLPPTSSPPPTQPPITTPPGIDAQIEGIIDRLEDFGDQFAEIIEDLRRIQEDF